MTPSELALALEAKRPEMLRIVGARLRYHGLEFDAMDIVQDAIVNLLEYQEPIREDDVSGLFFQVSSRLAYNRIGRDKRRQVRTDEYTRIYQHDSQAHMRQRERLKVDVELALGRLDERTAQIVRLVWMEGQNYRQVMKELKITDRTITEALETAKPILQHELARYDHRARPASVPAEDRCLTSQPAYKKEDDETDSSTALQAAMDRDEADETAAEIHEWFAEHIHLEPAETV